MRPGGQASASTSAPTPDAAANTVPTPTRSTVEPDVARPRRVELGPHRDPQQERRGRRHEQAGPIDEQAPEERQRHTGRRERRVAREAEAAASRPQHPDGAQAANRELEANGDRQAERRRQPPEGGDRGERHRERDRLGMLDPRDARLALRAAQPSGDHRTSSSRPSAERVPATCSAVSHARRAMEAA